MNPAPDPPASATSTRASLLQRVRDPADAASWTEFSGLYRKLIYGFARRSGLSHADAEDVTQDVFAGVAEKMPEFELDPNRGRFRGWLMQLTRWRIADKFASRPKEEVLREHLPSGGDSTDHRTSTIERVPAPEDEQRNWELEWQRHLLDTACERISRRTKPRHFQVLDLYVRKGWPLLEVARELRLNPGTVYVVSHRLKKQLKGEMMKLKDQLG
jgi:RNA polymerase sigma factor (sigma-70 family)